jgi:L-lactate dehydrogenase (cytochrome)
MADKSKFQQARLARVLNYEDARRHARWALPRGVFDYVDGGAEDEVTMRRNEDGFRDLVFRPKMGVWVAKPKLETTVFGETISMPLLTAPCGGMRLVHPEGDVGVARGAAAAGTIHIASAAASYSLEEIAQSPGSQWFQLYSFFAKEAMENLVDRAKAAGYTALVATIDTPVVGMREKDVRNGYGGGMRVNVSNAVKRAPQLLPRPAWVVRYVRDGMPFELANTAQMTRDGVPLLMSAMARGTASWTPTWDDIAWIRERWDGPLVAKGVLTAEDARRAVDAGCNAVSVSNHGGRQLESAPASIDALPEVVAAVNGEIDVFIDGGIRRGNDVLKALALGAKAAIIGRPYIWGLAIAGQTGVEHMLGLFRAEMSRSMQLMGCESIDDLDASWLTTVGPAAAHRAPVA